MQVQLAVGGVLLLFVSFADICAIYGIEHKCLPGNTYWLYYYYALIWFWIGATLGTFAGFYLILGAVDIFIKEGAKKDEKGDVKQKN